MGKILIEVCLISARGLRRSSSLWKLQWFAVGWIDADNKYCTKIDASGNENPRWETRFCTSVDASESKLQDLVLQVEVYCREPILLRETLLGTATISLREFLSNNPESSNAGAAVGSFQLRKRKASKPRGFVDVSIRVSEEREKLDSSYTGVNGAGMGFEYTRGEDGITLDTENGAAQFHQPIPGITTSSVAANYLNASAPGPSSSTRGGVHYNQPPAPPPPSNRIGCVPAILQNRAVSAPERGSGLGMGVGAGTLAAGAMVYRDDFMSRHGVPVGLQQIVRNVNESSGLTGTFNDLL